MTSALAAQRPHTHTGQVTDRPGQGGKNKEEEEEVEKVGGLMGKHTSLALAGPECP